MGAQASIFYIKMKSCVQFYTQLSIFVKFSSIFYQFYTQLFTFCQIFTSFYQKWYILPARRPKFPTYGKSCKQAANPRQCQILYQLQICGSCEFPQLENFTRSGNFWKLQTLNFSQIFDILYIESEREKKLLQIKPSNWVATLQREGLQNDEERIHGNGYCWTD